MGNTSLEPQLQIGEFDIQDNGSTATISCYFSQTTNLQLILQDKLGSSVLTKDFKVEESTEALNLSLADFKTGDYHAWIYVADKVFVRHLAVKKEQEAGLLERFFSIFK